MFEGKCNLSRTVPIKAKWIFYFCFCFCFKDPFCYIFICITQERGKYIHQTVNGFCQFFCKHYKPSVSSFFLSSFFLSFQVNFVLFRRVIFSQNNNLFFLCLPFSKCLFLFSLYAVFTKAIAQNTEDLEWKRTSIFSNSEGTSPRAPKF